MNFSTELVNCYHTPLTKKFIFSKSTRRNWYMIVPVTKSFWYKLGSFEGYAEFGDFVISPPGWTFHRASAEPFEFISLEFKWFDQNGIPYDAHSQAICGKVIIQDMSRYTSTIKKFRETKSILTPDILPYKNHLLHDILFIWIMEQHNYELKKSEDSVVLHTVKHLEKYYDQTISLKVLAEMVSLSQSQFSRRFQQATGLSPIQYLTEVRIQHASHLLLETDYTIERIATECGYQNGFYFSRVFSKKYGMSPSKFRVMNHV